VTVVLRDLKSSGRLGGAGDVVTRDMTLHIEDEIAASKNELKVIVFGTTVGRSDMFHLLLATLLGMES
jgi:hypothetical protein